MARLTLRQRLRRSRRRYKRRPTNFRLRALLKAKGRLSIFDKRMCDYYGVDADVVPGARRFIARGYGRGLVPTSTKRYPVGGGSYHQERDAQGRGRAADLGLRSELVGTAKGTRRMARFQRSEFRRRGRSKPRELIGPDNNKNILRGSPTGLAEGSALENQHDNHVHGAF